MQIIHKIINKKFEDFSKYNEGIFDVMDYGQIIPVNKDTVFRRHRMHPLDMFNSPFNIAYFGKQDGGEGDFHIFFDKNMDKLYSYFTAE